MKSMKTFIIIAVVVLIIAFVLNNFGFIFGFLVGGGLVWFFGKEKIKQTVDKAVESTKVFADGLEEKLMPKEEKEAVITSAFSASAPEGNGLFQIVLVAGGVSYLLEPSSEATLPNELNGGHKIKITSTYQMEGMRPVKSVTITDEAGKEYKVKA